MQVCNNGGKEDDDEDEDAMQCNVEQKRSPIHIHIENSSQGRMALME